MTKYIELVDSLKVRQTENWLPASQP